MTMQNQLDVIVRQNEFLLQRKEMIIFEMSSKKQINFNVRHEISLELENKLETIFEGLIMMQTGKSTLFGWS